MSSEKQTIPTNGQPIVYVRLVKTRELPKQIRLATGDLDEVYAIHSETGEYIALARDRDMAFVMARQNDLAPVSVH